MILILRKHKVGIQITAEKLEKKHGGYYWKLGTIENSIEKVYVININSLKKVYFFIKNSIKKVLQVILCLKEK